MSNTNTGGPAFPTGKGVVVDDYQGMTLRDYFAAKAMQAWLVGVNLPNADVCAITAYEIADAMLEAREA